MMKLKLSSIISAVIMGSLLAGCAPKDPFMGATTPLGEKSPERTSAVVPGKIEVQPKVDVLFVIDTSESMLKHQENLKANIDRFVEAFKVNKGVDFHIGVISIWDSNRYGKVVAAPFPLGKLRGLKDPQHPGEVVSGVPYVTRAERFSEILGESLKLGIENRYVRDANGKIVHVNGKTQDAGGPEFEDMFTPILPALGEQNGDFYRSDAHLAVVIVTDADDASEPAITPDKLFQDLVDKKGSEDLVSIHAAVALDGCPVDPGLESIDPVTGKKTVERPEKILSLVQMSHGSYMNLCDPNYGDKLGEVGRVIEQKATRLIQVSLDHTPEDGTLQVTYNGKPLPIGKAWSYDKKFWRVQIHGDDPIFASAPGGEIGIVYTPLDLDRVARGKVVPVNGQ
jgi:hypothetical protein